MNLEFFGKNTQMGGRNACEDVDIHVNKTNVTIVFRNKAISITKKYYFVKFAIVGNRLYFDFCNERDGYRLQKTQSMSTNYVAIGGTRGIETIGHFAGKFKINFDKENGYHYIEKKIAFEGIPE